MKIAILGGAFNPPHLGHVWVAQQVLEYTNVDRVWFLPNYSQKYYGIDSHKLVVSAKHRLAMTKLLDTDRMTTSTLEIDHQTSGQTRELLPLLPAQNEYSFIIGSDLLRMFTKWHDYEKLLRVMQFLVFPRYESPIKKENLLPGMQMLPESLLIESNLSSTMIRDRISSGLSIEEFVPPKVAKYIYAHKLYKEGVRRNIEKL